MKDKVSIAAKVLWTAGGYAASLGVRFLSSVIIARLLDPQILGIMVIAQAVRVGTELLTDVGIEQNVVSNPQGDQPRFLNAAWTLQLMRGLFIASVLLAMSPFLSGLYDIPVGVFMAVSAAPLINSFTSTSILSLSRNLNAKARSIFELASEVIGLVINVAIALAMPNFWAPIIGLLLGLAVRASLSYLLPHPAHRLVFDKQHMLAIIHFGKWIMLSSLGFYAAMYIDRLYLGKVLAIATLGVYGLARTVADLPLILASRLASQIMFPIIAAHRADAEGPGMKELAVVRFRFLLLAAFGIASVMAWSDLAIRVLYDNRYEEAGWMLFLLLMNAWVGVLAYLGEAATLGNSKPQVASLANICRIVIAAACLPLGFHIFGLAGAILALPLGEFARYLVLHVAQRSPSVPKAGLQDIAATAGLVAILAFWIGLRVLAGLGVPWGAL